MENKSAVTSFILTAYTELEDHRYLYFICLLLFYVMIIVVNSVIIIVIYTEKGLHEPMYLLISCLAVNGVFGSTCLLPHMLVFLLSHSYDISLSCCLLQIYCLTTYVHVEFTILAVMGYDRYVAICHPLHYHLLMSHKKTCTAIILSWVIPFIYFALIFIMTVQRTFCGRIIKKVYCASVPLFELSCFDTTIQNIVGTASNFISPFSQLLMILFSYVKIFRICLFASKESQSKVMITCSPHLLSLINFTVGLFSEAMQGRFDMSQSNHDLPHKARIFLSIHMGILPPLFNAVIYGITIQAIKVRILNFFSIKPFKLRVFVLKR